MTALVRVASWLYPVEKELVDLSDDALVKRAIKGDRTAFSELVLRHERVVFNLALRFMRDEARAEDMAQEAFLKAYRMIPKFRGDCKFSSWMYRVTSSVCLTELKRSKRRGEVPFEPVHHGSTTPRTDHLDMPELIRDCVTQLPDNYAAVVTLYYLDEISYEDIAEILDVPMGTLKTWLFRARNQLRAIVEKALKGTSDAGS